jgi:hypothetical protein
LLDKSIVDKDKPAVEQKNPLPKPSMIDNLNQALKDQASGKNVAGTKQSSDSSQAKVGSGLSKDKTSLKAQNSPTKSLTSKSDPTKHIGQESTFQSPAPPNSKASYYDTKGCGSFGLGSGGSCRGGGPLRRGDVAVPIGSNYKPNEIINTQFCGPSGCSVYSMRVHDTCAGCTRKGVGIDVWGNDMRQKIEKDTGYNFSGRGFFPVTIFRVNSR